MIARTIARYGVRSAPGDEKVVIEAFRRGAAVSGPAIEEFEGEFAKFHGIEYATATSFGRMAFHYILRALNLPAGSEIIFPALTFWAVPEMARRNGLRPVFVDVDPATFNLDPAKLEAALTERTRAIVPTHLYGLPCAMTEVMKIAEKYDLVVIEDCAQAIGAQYRGQRVGTFGTAAFFSFQLLKGINTYGGGMVLTNDIGLSRGVRAQAVSEPPQTLPALARRFAAGYGARVAISPKAFTFWGYPLQAAVSLLGHHDLSRFVWEKIRPLEQFPRTYHQRYSNVQALLGLRGLANLERHNQRCREHATQYTRGLIDCRNIQTPRVPVDVEHVFYQYCVYTSDSTLLSQWAIRRGIDIETTHVDVCPKLDLFKEFSAECPGAEATEKALQLPVYSRLRDSDIDRVLRIVREASSSLDVHGNSYQHA
ncbi:MAG TPA: aminotransferase class I/II-fold pyridoxal phosphate-dependent enzyme [Pyrinomonadaceae bacterium]